jgi:hypothetical protein
MLLIATIGIGTDTAYSSFAEGMLSTLAKLKPRQYWLVSSSNENSRALADMIRETCELEHGPDPEDGPLMVVDVDNPLAARDVMRKAIRHVHFLNPNEDLMINPTGGTKAMAAGAMLAAVADSRVVTSVSFIGGNRGDRGVVATGTEKLSSTDLESVYCERALEQAEELFQRGALRGARLVLKPFQKKSEAAARARQQAEACEHWQNLNFKEALNTLGNGSAAAEELYGAAYLETLVKAPPYSLSVLAEVWASAVRLQKWGYLNDAFLRFFQCLEQAPRVRLSGFEEIEDVNDMEALSKIAPEGTRSRNDLSNKAGSGGFANPRELYELLETKGDQLGKAAVPSMDRINKTSRKRNQYAHKASPVDAACVNSIRSLVTKICLESGVFNRELFSSAEKHWPARLT